MIPTGDSNANLGNYIKQKLNKMNSNDKGEVLVNFCCEIEVRLNNVSYDHKLQHEYNFLNSCHKLTTN